MAKRTRASARRSKTRRSSSSKVRKSNVERTKKAVEARRCKFSPELEARARYLFEETDASMADIAFELGIHKCTVPDVAKRRNWKRYVPPPRDVSPATRILLETENLERRRETLQPAPDAERAMAAQPDGGSGESRKRPCHPPAACGAQRAHRGRVVAGPSEERTAKSDCRRTHGTHFVHPYSHVAETAAPAMHGSHRWIRR